MRAYHIRTREHDPYNPASPELVDVNFVYVPDKDIMFGFIKLPGNKGRVVNYSDEEHRKRAQEIVKGRAGKEFGEIVDDFDLGGGIVGQIAKSMPGNVRTKAEYDLSSGGLVDILDGNNIRKTILTRIRRCLYEIFG